MKRLFCVLCTIFSLFSTLIPRASALSPDRSLTQALRRIWQFQQGLPDANILCVRQLDPGYLYLGTPTGLIRFDGIRFTRIEAVGDVWVQDVLADKSGDIWVATDGNGVLRLHEGTATGYGTDAGLPSLSVRGIFLDRDGRVVACTFRGVAEWNGAKFVVLGKDIGDVAAGCAARDGKLWFVGNGAKVMVGDGNRFERLLPKGVLPTAGFNAILEGDDGVMWIGTTWGLLRIKNGEERLFTSAEGLADEMVYSVTQGTNGVVWVGTRNGFSRVRSQADGRVTIDSFRAQDGLSQSTVYSVCEDREGSVWVGTKHGLNQFWDGRVIPFTVSEGLPSNEVGPVIDDGSQAGGAWVGTNASGLSHFDRHRFTTPATAQVLHGSSVLSLAPGHPGEWWIGTSDGVYRLSGDAVEGPLAVVANFNRVAVNKLFRTREGAIWAGSENGAVVWNNPGFRPAAGGEAFADAAIGGFAERDGELLIATRDERLLGYKEGKTREIARGELLRGVDSLVVDGDGLVWAGTDGGGLRLVDVQTGKVTAFSVREGLFDDEIYGIVADGDDRLWMACSKGIFYVPRGDLKAFAAGKLAHLTSSPFSPTEGLRTIECRAGVQPAAWRMGDGRLWFSTIHGVIVIDPKRLQRASGPVPAVIEDVVVNGHSERADEIGQMPPGGKNLEFEYTGLAFIAPARITFRYRLEGFDKEWVDAGGRREAFYTNLPPRTYRFRVQAKNIEGVWGGEAVTGEFSLAPALYQRPWFWPALAVMAVAAGVAGYRLRIRAIKGRMGAIVAERIRIARELHDTLLQGFSGVTMEMQALSARLPESAEKGTLKEIIRDAANCMTEARRSVAGLRRGDATGGELGEAVAEAARQLTETRDVKLELDVDAGLPPLGAEVEYNLVRICQEAVTNAVKHSGARVIEVAVKRSGAGVRVVVRDDGRGFEGTVNGVGGHYGIVGMRERAAAIGGRIEVKSGSGEGTVVEVVAGE